MMDEETGPSHLPWKAGAVRSWNGARLVRGKADLMILFMSVVEMITSSNNGTLPPTSPVLPPCNGGQRWWSRSL